MSAKELTFFLPKGLNKDQVIQPLVEGLALKMINIPNDIEVNYELLARRGEGKSILEMEYTDNARGIIEELSEWENPSDGYKDLLLNCHSCITLYYRDADDARNFIKSIAAVLSEMAATCIIENGEGCLLTLSETARCLSKDETWSWERREFPELPNVAISEWAEMK
ncbi:hypothetical protein H0A36_14550 [Endozoicomonas sp. SM1973]|uniref:Uncharacterized protein n=1 Tax=Spartinivicinus marinus TaxID=2994442 RepID=A0A853IDH4_9GAMM|nr:hypothetical protein [Spartinivicinus marinus]MCX4028568.1 hypothetical protein [Spartinivicinus marinus]NYZ67235.1 hypothetical protein [Spartinivicinus marinus]